MNSVIVDIADMVVSANPEDTLVTYSLGSCLGIVVYDPTVHVGGMIHCMLPMSKVDDQKGKDRPCMFVDTGMSVFLGKLFEMGVRKTSAIVKVAGGAQVLDKQNLFRIGERNYAMLRKVLWKNGLLIKTEDVGGDLPRTIWLEIATGRFLMRKSGVEQEL